MFCRLGLYVFSVASAAADASVRPAEACQDENQSSVVGTDTISIDMNGQVQELHALWLRERCTESFYVDASTLQPHYQVHEEPEDLRILTTTPSEGSLQVFFNDGQNCNFSIDHMDAEVRRHHTSTIQAGQTKEPDRVLWDKTLISPPVISYADVSRVGGDAKLRLVHQLVTIGIAVVSGVPRRESFVTEFGNSISTVRSTDWGDLFNVRVMPDNVSGTSKAPTKAKADLAYSRNAIGLHTDNPYRDPVPDFQLLHAIEHCNDPPHSTCDNYNTFVDGFKVAERLRYEDPEAFRLLSEISVRFENNGGDNTTAIVSLKPIITLKKKKGLGEIQPIEAIHFSQKSGGYAPSLEPERLTRFYHAKRKFSKMLHSAEFGIHVKPAAGAIAIFDNKRILHGRSEVKESEAARWLQGCYVNRDGLWATYEREQRFFAETAPQWKALNETTKSDLELMGREYSEAVDNKMVEIAKNLIRKQHNGNLLGQPLSLFDHGLQTASRALRANASDEVVVVSLLHDAFETMVTKNHGEMAAAFLAPWISPQSQWILSHHEIFQIFYYGGQLGMNRTLRDMFIDSPHFNATVAWCEQFDAPAFDPDYPMLPLSVFDGPLERVFSRQQYWWDPKHPKAGAVTMTKQAATADQ